ncbi:MAG TPA: hypothetical protein VF053_04145 [Streptosporangiales bacterium]
MLTMPLRVTLGAVLGAALLAIGAPFAHAQADHHGGGGSPVPGDNGTVDVHRSGTPVDRPCNQPKVCKFYLVARGFDAGQQVTWVIKAWAPTGDNATVVKTGTLTLDQNGAGHTPDLGLPNGHYKLFWNFVGENGKAKHKVFWVKCPRSTGKPTPTPSTSTPSSTPSSTPPTAEPSPSPTHSTPAPPAGAPTPVQTNLPVTG